MRQTVVGVFNKYSAAQQAAQDLRDSGFGDSVFVTGEASASVRPVGEQRQGQGVLESVRIFFADLLSSDDADREVSTYADAVRRGGAVVKVEVEEEETDAARSALEAAGAMDVGEQSQLWESADEFTRVERGGVGGVTAEPAETSMEGTAGVCRQDRARGRRSPIST